MLQHAMGLPTGQAKSFSELRRAIAHICQGACDSVNLWITGYFAFAVARSGKWSRTSVARPDLFANRVALAVLRLSTLLRVNVSRGMEALGQIGSPRLMKTGYPIYLENAPVDTAIVSTWRTSNLRRNNGY